MIQLTGEAKRKCLLVQRSRTPQFLTAAWLPRHWAWQYPTLARQQKLSCLSP